MLHPLLLPSEYPPSLYLCSPPASLPTGPVIPCTAPPPPPPTLYTSSIRHQLRDMVQHTEGCSHTLHSHTHSPTHFNCTLDWVWLIKSSPVLIGQITVNNLDCVDCFSNSLLNIIINCNKTNLNLQLVSSYDARCWTCNTSKPCTV